ncbi:MAG: replication-associated recombination protein A [Clostridia bacterium]|nr:replication-associated recombination protein A [Clostridia bacterium]
MDLFDFTSNADQAKPLAERMRPRTLSEFIGQKHIVGEGTLLRRAIAADRLGSCIFYGVPGSGKTSLANIIAETTKSHFEKLNAVSSGVADAKKVIDEARARLKMYGTKTYLLLDECHRWSKAQSDCMLSAIEEGVITFIGSTTENPFIAMTKAIVSRCRLFEFKPLSSEEIVNALRLSLSDERGLKSYNVKVEDGVFEHFAYASDGDLRIAYNALELAVITTPPDNNGVVTITKEIASQSVQKKYLAIDESTYYDMISAFCKSLRGSDADAAVYWMERLISSGCDPLLVCRRLVVHSAEDVGMADPYALTIAISALTAMQNIGLPEGRIPLTEAIIYVCEASKSNSVVRALYSAHDAVEKTYGDIVPKHLKDANYKQEKIEGYKYPHSFGGWVEQQYLPDAIKDETFYEPSSNGFEKTLQRAKVLKRNKG